jgi:hypothetical protein
MIINFGENKMFDKFNINGKTALYHRVPIQFLGLFRSEMSNQNKFFKVRYRGPRANTPSARYRSAASKQSTCLKQDATHFSAYTY